MNIPPQLPCPGQACSARRARSSSSGSPAAWKAATRSIRSPVTGSCPGRIDPSDRITAGTLCSNRAATVPTGGLSQATTATRPATRLAARCRDTASFTSSRPISEYRISGVPLSWPSDTPRVKAGAIKRTARSSPAIRRDIAACTAATFAWTPR